MYYCTCGAEITDPSKCGFCGEKFEEDAPAEKPAECPRCNDATEDYGADGLWCDRCGWLEREKK